MSENPNPASATPPPPETAPTEPPASSAPSTEWPVMEESAPSESAASSPAVSDTSSSVDQSSLAAPRGLSYAVDIVFCIDVTGSMTPIIDQVKTNALRFYDDVQSNLTAKGKNVDQLDRKSTRLNSSHGYISYAVFCLKKKKKKKKKF